MLDIPFVALYLVTFLTVFRAVIIYRLMRDAVSGASSLRDPTGQFVH